MYCDRRLNLDWVAVDSAANAIYFGVFFNVKRVMRARLDTLARLPDLEIAFPPDDQRSDFGVQYVQSAAIAHRGATPHLVLLGDDYQTTVTWVDLSSGRYVGGACNVVFMRPMLRFCALFCG